MTSKLAFLLFAFLSVFSISPLNAVTPSPFLPVTPPQLQYKPGALICSLTNFGLVAGGSFGPALEAAYEECVIGTTKRTSTAQQAVIVAPPGTYYLETYLLLRGGVNWFLHLNGTQILYTTAVSGYVFIIQYNNGFTLSGDYEGTLDASLRGSVNGQADLYPPFGSSTRLFKLDGGSNIVIGRFNLIQSPSYSLVVNDVTNLEIFQTLVNGVASHGATDGMDISGNNIYVHDCQVHDGDECVTVKSPTNNALIENIFCQYSSPEFGSFGEWKTAAESGSVAISNIVYRNIYSISGTGFYIKACTTDNGYIRNVTVENVVVDSVPYPIGVNFYWSCAGYPEGKNGGGNLLLSDLTINGVTGTILDGTKRPVIKVECDLSSTGNFPTCQNVNIQNINVWPTPAGATSVYDQCSNAQGTGACLSPNSFSNTTTFKYYTVRNQGAAPAPTWGLIQYPITPYPDATYPPTTSTKKAA